MRPLLWFDCGSSFLGSTLEKKGAADVADLMV